MIWLRVASCSWQAEACDASQCAQAAGSCPDDILMGRLACQLTKHRAEGHLWLRLCRCRCRVCVDGMRLRSHVARTPRWGPSPWTQICWEAGCGKLSLTLLISI